jgi:hypothetical protein
LLHWTSAGGPQGDPTLAEGNAKVIEDIGSVDERDLNGRVEQEQQRETSRRQKELFPNYGAWTHVTDVLDRAIRTEPHQRLPNHAEQRANGMLWCACVNDELPLGTSFCCSSHATLSPRRKAFSSRK